MHGIKCTLYDEVNVKEKAIYFAINEYAWQFTNIEYKKKMHHKCIDLLPLSNYYLSLIFKDIVVPMILEAIVINCDSEIPVLEGCKEKDSNYNISNISRIDSIISIEKIMKFYKLLDAPWF